MIYEKEETKHYCFAYYRGDHFNRWGEFQL